MARAGTPSVRTVGIVVLVALALLVAIAVGIGATFDRPTLESTTNEWGSVTAETTEIRTTATVHNPNAYAIPGVIALEYDVALNDVQLASARRGGIGLRPGENTIQLTTTIDNDRVTEWWVSQVNSGGTSTLRISPTVAVPLYAQQLPAQTRTVETDFLGSLGTDQSSSVRLLDRGLLTIGPQRVEWGTANASASPVVVSTELTNRHDRPVRIDGFRYEITMAGVTVGNGTTDGVRLDPGESQPLTLRPVIETPRIAEWWASHIQNGEQTRLTVTMAALVERDGQTSALDLPAFSKQTEIQTDILGSNATTVRQLPTDATTPNVTLPSIDRTESEWGAVTDESTEVVTTAYVSPGEAPDDVASLVTVDFTQATTINGVPVSNASTTLSPFPREATTVAFRSPLASDDVPVWWARHVNNGERSVRATTVSAVADVGFTTFPLAIPSEESTFETDLLAPFDSNTPDDVTASGRTVFDVSRTDATWGTATPDRSPIETSATMTNRLPVPVTIQSIDYRIDLNDVTVGEDTVAVDTTLSPGERETIDPTLAIDNRKLATWWPTHVRQGERSEMTVTATATIEFNGQRRTVPLSFLEESTTVETDVLASE